MWVVLGKISVAAAGTPVQITASAQYQAMTEMDTRFLSCQAVLFQAWKDNGGLLYVGKVGMNKSTGALVAATLAIPSTASIASYGASNHLSPAGINLSEFYLDADIAADGALVSLLVS